MDIIIAGAGKLGFNLAKSLSIKHNVIVVDKNIKALHSIQESLDILPLRGDIEDAKTYKSLMSKKIDLFIAVTNSDNANLISTMIASSILDIQKRFVRLRKYFNEVVVKNKLDIDEIIFPIKESSKGISTLLKYPKANNVKVFKYTQHKLISFKIPQEIIPKKLNMLQVTIVGIQRARKFFIPKHNDNTEIKPNDLVYFFGDADQIKQLCLQYDKQNSTDIKKCVIFGAGDLGISTAKELLNINCEVKLIEKDIKLCYNADEELNGTASVIHSKYGTYDVFEDTELENADIFISATNNDEYNIIKCLEAKEFGIKKVIAINNEPEYYNLMHSLGLVATKGPKMSAYNKIMEGISATEVVLKKGYCGGEGFILMRKIFVNSKAVNQIIEPLNLKNAILFYMKDDVLYKFDEEIVMQEGYVIITFGIKNEIKKIKSWMYEL